ncbi:helix-turn-helix domain-containing protein [Peteryoungia ipomoeae]|nr:helix-turn-helix domain-containing protein [Peteryoungia ipomoeae]
MQASPSPHYALRVIELPDLPPQQGASPFPEAAPSPQNVPNRLLCMIIREFAQHLLEGFGMVPSGVNSRRAHAHIRQVSMYVCHVTLPLSMEEVARAFGRDRSTVSHACRMVESRRDDPAYDAFVGTVERMAGAVALLSRHAA